MTASATLHDYGLISIAQIVESPKNPRKHFDEVKLNELAASIREHGVITPLLVREINADEPGELPMYELAAGHRRYRASRLAGLTELPVVVREMTDTQLLEVLTIENLQRDDVHELEEARGFQDLITDARYTVERIAERIGKSTKYVYDRIKLLQLTPELQELFFAKKIEAGHAIILARLSPTDQKRAAHTMDGGLWQQEHGHQTDIESMLPPAGENKHGHLKAKSVRELQYWVNTYVRLDPTATDTADLFPDTHAAVATSREIAEKILPITENYHVDPTAKADGERTFGPKSWKRADGRQKSKTCESSVLGVIVVGRGRGESFRVCTDKQKCRVHWGAEIRAREQRAGTPASKTAATKTTAPTKQPWQLEQEKRDAKRAAWEKAESAVVKSLADRVKALSPSTLMSVIEDECPLDPGVEKLIGRGKGLEGFVRLLAFQILHDSATSHRAYEHFPKYAKQIGLDVAKVVAANTPKPEPKAAAVGTKPVFDTTAPAPKGAKNGKSKRSPSAVFMKPLHVSSQLRAIVGDGPMPRTEVTKKLWAYIKKHGLQDKKERRFINADDTLKLVLGGKAKVSMFEMTKHINKHVRGG